ncbi:hypothetical protein NP233_g1181 [Leucocoprinus birnbaumii]|uniref:Cytochrome P450 n=1 Tax=Leucocoprinus birnbaumii TaxID=56174 RepID=A0AAD5W0Z2_9AGAR|nr:hypothetical protein NP233_g1181 [Leucocoprinus birnbaumii]
MLSTTTTALAAMSACLLLYIVSRDRGRKNYPPSPPGLPLLGNTLDIPPRRAWERFAEWSRELGSPIISVNVLGNRIIVLNDARVADELLEKRSGIYSSRPRFPFVNEAAGFHHWNWAFSGEPELWKPARREFEFHTRQSMVRNYHNKEVHMVLQTMKKILDTPENFMDHCRFASGFLILSMIYGLDDPIEAEKYIDKFDRGSEGFEAAMNKNIIDILPWTRHIPLWMSSLPGFGWRHQVEEVKIWGASTRDVMLDWYLSHRAQEPDSVIANIIERSKNSMADEQSRIAFAHKVAGVSYLAGTTTVGAFRFIILVMVLFPDVQKRYIVAVCKETIRWTTVPHAPIQDDWYDGYLIPKGSQVVHNSWAIFHDPSVYPSPEKFSPDRFLTAEGQLDPTVPDPMAGFGSGRRLCPGRFIALDEMFLFTAYLVSLFSIRPAIDPTSGDEIRPSPCDGEGLIGQPKPFPCTIEPRSPRTEVLLDSTIRATTKSS